MLRDIVNKQICTTKLFILLNCTDKIFNNLLFELE